MHKFPAKLLGIAGAQPMFSIASPAKTTCLNVYWRGYSFIGKIFHFVFGYFGFPLKLIQAAEGPQVVDHTPQNKICTALFRQGGPAISHPKTRDSLVHPRNSGFLKLLERDTITVANRLDGFSVSECISNDSDGESRKVVGEKQQVLGYRIMLHI